MASGQRVEGLLKDATTVRAVYQVSPKVSRRCAAHVFMKIRYKLFVSRPI